MICTFTTARIVYGPGSRSSIATEASRFGRRCVLVTGSSVSRIQWLMDALQAVMEDVLLVSVNREPDVSFVERMVRQVRTARCTVVVAIGGGSVLDAGKALAALVTNTREVMDYLEVVGRGMPLDVKPLPVIAVPTTAGTGSEVTANAVLSVPEHGVKVSLRSADMIPHLAVVDPELALSLPPAQTLATGLDALTQLMEAYVSHAHNPLTAPFCRDGMARVRRSLARAVQDGSDLDAREDMALASLYSGMALANGKLGAVHGFAAPLGAMLGASHGAICAALLPHVMTVNIAALKERKSTDKALQRYAEVAQILCDSHDPEAGVRWVLSLSKELGAPSLADLGARVEHFDEYAAKASKASSMRGNPIELTLDELREILRLSS